MKISHPKAIVISTTISLSLEKDTRNSRNNKIRSNTLSEWSNSGTVSAIASEVM
jgi:hypothetical protein